MFIKKSRQAYSHKQCCKNVQRKLFITLDSDDTCTNDALETFVNEWNKIPKQEQKYYGISCRTYDKDGKLTEHK